MRHRWHVDPVTRSLAGPLGDPIWTCARCGMQRRKALRHCPGVNPMRPRYWVWEYRRLCNSELWMGYSPWGWWRKREPVPPCPGVRPGTGSVPCEE